jgi:hypothetical protein
LKKNYFKRVEAVENSLQVRRAMNENGKPFLGNFSLHLRLRQKIALKTLTPI